MARPVQVRTADDWRTEVARLRRMAAAAEIDPSRSPRWKSSVRSLADALGVLLETEPEREREAIRRALARVLETEAFIA